MKKCFNDAQEMFTIVYEFYKIILTNWLKLNVNFFAKVLNSNSATFSKTLHQELSDSLIDIACLS